MSGVPLPEAERLVKDYNAEINREGGFNHFTMLRIARRGKHLYYQTGDLDAGAVAGSSLIYLGKHKEANALFLDIEKGLRLDPDNDFVRDLVFRHAISLVRISQPEEAWVLLKPFRKVFHLAGLKNGTAILMAAYAVDPDLMFTLYLELLEYEIKENNSKPAFAVVLLYLAQSTISGAWQKAFEYANQLAMLMWDEPLSLENLEHFIDALSADLSTWNDSGEVVNNYADEIEVVQKILHMFLTYPENEIYFQLPVNHAGKEYIANVTREYNDNGFSAVIKTDDGVIITEGDDLEELKAMIKDAISLDEPDAA